MSDVRKKRLDRYSMMIVSKYFKTVGDFIKMIRICKKYQEIPEMFHYNPVKLMKKTKLFPNIETYHIYDKNEKKIEGYEKYVYWHQVNFETFLGKKENEEFKNVRFSLGNWGKYKSFKGANILGEDSLSRSLYTEIDLSGITKIENCCFKGNRHIKHIKLDRRISTIPDCCFENCVSLVELDLSHIKILGNYCFHYCASLTALTLPETLFEIGKNCFYGIDELEKIETKGIRLIGSNMNYSLYESFKRNGIDVKGDISFKIYDRNKYGNQIPEEISIIDSKCFNYVKTIGDVTLPKSVTKLEEFCFNYCSIKSIDLSNVLVNDCYFYNCNELTSVTISKNVIEPLENGYCSLSFYNSLPSLKNIELSDTNHIPIVSNHLRKLMEDKGYRYDKCIYIISDANKTNSVIPEEVNIIGGYVFDRLYGIINVTIPSNVIHLCFNNFNSMDNLESIEIQSTNVRCDNGCFNSLPKIKELDLRGITSFGNNCIFNCSSLTKVIIQNVPIEQGLNCCNSLKEIEIIGIENNEYEHPINYRLAQLLEKKGIHCKRKIFTKFELLNKVECYCVPDSVNEIESYAFQYCKLKEITIPPSITLINSYAFDWCAELSHVIIEGTPEIKNNSFCGCPKLIQNQLGFKQYP